MYGVGESHLIIVPWSLLDKFRENLFILLYQRLSFINQISSKLSAGLFTSKSIYLGTLFDTVGSPALNVERLDICTHVTPPL